VYPQDSAPQTARPAIHAPDIYAPDWLPATLHCELDDTVAILRLNRPDKRNALNVVTIEGLRRFFTDPPAAARVVVLCGAGEHFSAGLDLADVTGHDATQGVFHSRLWHRAFAALEGGDLPVVAVLHGAVIGGGLELAAAAHIRVAEASTYYALPEGQRGLFVGGGGSVRIPRLIGAARMMDMMLTGRAYDAPAGAAIGLSHYQAAAGEGRAMGIALARRIAGNAKLSNFAILQALPRIADADPATGYLIESLVSAITAAAPEAKQRLADFLEKRAPKVTRG
jgi:enoyl-CoA hydratase/carnithine racemase